MIFACIIQNIVVTLHRQTKRITIHNQKLQIMKTNEVRQVRVNQDRRQVFFNLSNGNTVVRTMDVHEIMQANRLGRQNGEDARIAEYVRLFNESYSEPQKITYQKLTAEEERFFELHNMGQIIPLPADMEEEYETLLNND